MSASYFFDWLKIEQDFGFEIPKEIIANLFDFVTVNLHIETGEFSDGFNTPIYHHKGSFCDTVSIKIRGSVITMEGNPSRWGRVENLVGFTTIDACVHRFNSILMSLKLPCFTRCTKIFYRQEKENSFKNSKFSDGAIIKRIDITSNKCVGRGNEKTFLRGLSSQRYRNSIGRLHTNLLTVDWLSAQGKANLIYPSVYVKGEELKLNSAVKIKNKFGTVSKEFDYFMKVVDYCDEMGVVRFEQKLKSRFLQRENLCFWGISDFSKLEKINNDFLNIYKNMRVSKMDYEDLTETLLSSGAVKSLRQANSTAFYAMKWANGSDLGLSVSQFKIHRARLRKIGIDIANPCDVDKFQPVRVISCKEILLKDFKAPDFYIYPNNLKIAV